MKKQNEEDARKLRAAEQEIEVLRKRLDRKTEEMKGHGRGRSAGKESRKRNPLLSQGAPGTENNEGVGGAAERIAELEDLMKTRAVEMEVSVLRCEYRSSKELTLNAFSDLQKIPCS